MKTKLFTLLLAVAASVGTIFAAMPIEKRGELEINGFYYLLDQNNYTASFTYHGDGPGYIYDYYSGDVSIPTSVVYNNKIYTVTSIGERAFYNCSGLTSVTIPNSVTSIEYGAFYSCSGLTSVTIPNSVTSIGNDAFEGCSGLTSVTIGNGVRSIGDDVFSGCTGLTSPVYNAHVFAFMPTTYSGAYTIPDGIASIAGYAFYNCTGLTSVTIPNSVTSIGSSAFSGCTGLTSVTIPNSVTSIGGGAFSGCSGLTSVTIPNSVTSIEYGAFSSCSGLTSVTIPNSVTSIAGYAFYNCTGLTSVTIHNSVTSIGGGAFSGCTGLTSVTIPNSVTSIGYEAFYNCTSLTNIFVTCGDLDRVKQLFNNDSRVKYKPLPYSVTVDAQNGTVSSPQNICDALELTATPNKGYHFTRWSDGDTHNPRTFTLTRDTTFTAVFEKNRYTITTASSNSEWGTTGGDKDALYLDEVEISATANSGYHFVKWNDGKTQNPRVVTVTEDKIYTATFAKNTYNITKKAEHGTISGNSSAEYLDEITLTVSPNFGYHFTQWSDGDTHNPRTFTLTQDTTFTAEFGIDKTGTCGDDLALTWTFDEETKELIISGEGALNSNYTFGVEAPTSAEKVIFEEGVTSIGNSAFANYTTIQEISIPSSVKKIYEQAFYNCENLQNIYNYRAQPAVVYSNTFDGIDKFGCKLYVPTASIEMYKAATGWRDFFYIEALVIKYKVTFLDWDETILSTQDVVSGEAAIAPANPTRTGYTFTGWDKASSNVTEEMTVTAQYQINQYKVDFADWDGTLLKTENVTYNTAATPPADPSREWYTFVGWDKDYSAVTADLIVTAQYEEGQVLDYNITFTNSRDNSEISIVPIQIEVPAPPVIAGFTFVNWEIVSGDIRDGFKVQAVYTADVPASAPEVYTNPTNPAQKLIRNGNVYILTENKTYTITGQQVK